MKILAICKTFRGHEFVCAMLASIKGHCAGILMVNSDIGWSGGTGNTVVEHIKEHYIPHMLSNHIPLVMHDFNSADQDAQYVQGLHVARDLWPDAEMYLIVDTDEVWTDADLAGAIAFMESNPQYDAYSCEMHTYIKSPFYRVDPPEPEPGADHARAPAAGWSGGHRRRRTACQEIGSGVDPRACLI